MQINNYLLFHIMTTLLLACMISSNVEAAVDMVNVQPRLQAKFKAWEVRTENYRGHKRCYISTSPTEQHGKKKRLNAKLVIMHISNDMDEVTTVSDAVYQGDEAIELLIDKRHQFTLGVVKATAAWAQNEQDDLALVRAMKHGVTLSMTTKNYAGATISTEVFSLMGFGNAYTEMKKICAS